MIKKEIIPTHNFVASPMAESSNFNIGLLEDITPVSMYRFPHRHSFYEILFIQSGDGSHVIDFETYTIQPNTLYFISPGQIHFWQASSPIEGTLINFAEEFLLPDSNHVSMLDELNFFHGFEDAPQLQLQPHQVGDVISLLEALKNEFVQQDIMGVSVLRSYMHILLVKIQRMYALNEQRHEQLSKVIMVSQFKRLVAKHFMEERNIKYYADTLGISVGYLAEIIKTGTGLTPGGHIRRQLILESKHLLTNTELAVSQVAYSLKFEDPSYFCRFFKRETGLSADAFRKQIRKRF